VGTRNLDTYADLLLLTQSEAAEYLHVEPRTLEGWRQRRQGPRFHVYSKRCVRYSLSDLREWLGARAVETVDCKGDSDK